MNRFYYYLFRVVPLDEGGKVLHYVGKYKTWKGLQSRRQRDSHHKTPFYAAAIDKWDMDGKIYRNPPYPVLPGRVPSEIQHVSNLGG